MILLLLHIESDYCLWVRYLSSLLVFIKYTDLIKQ
nr:MAG TPA: hypothetical protein [Caudoviricetes sp.]